MIIVRIIGGLGNQMFQYALGVHLAKKTGATVKMDISGFTIYKLHKYCLPFYKIQLPVATEDDVKKFAPLPLARFANTAFAALRIPISFRHPRYVKERGMDFQKEILDIKNDAYLDGYWQSEKYFLDVASQIRTDLQVATAPDAATSSLLQEIGSTSSVALHIRRGDYVSDKNANSVHGVLPLQYYHRAIQFITEKISTPTFYIFSDDPAWVKEHLAIKHEAKFMDQNTADKNYEDLRLISACKHQIIANSSFSWWGAWLNPDPEKTVVAPKAWFTGIPFRQEDRIPASWNAL